MPMLIMLPMQACYTGALIMSNLSQVWNTRGVEGVHRFLARTFRVFEPGMTEDVPTKDQMRMLHATIKKVSKGEAWNARLQ